MKSMNEDFVNRRILTHVIVFLVLLLGLGFFYGMADKDAMMVFGFRFSWFGIIVCVLFLPIVEIFLLFLQNDRKEGDSK